MCGISGIFHVNGSPIDRHVIERMTTRLSHRGPDGFGHYLGEGVALGHRRLSVIDPHVRGQQPMVSDNGRYSLTYNGEIYNYQELRKELMQLGFSFKTQTDTEVLLNALIAWGIGCLPRLNGMFAFAFWDDQERTLYLARDRYGVKPLYLFQHGGCLLFASEIKAFLDHPRFTVDMDYEALVEYLTFQNYFTDRTLFKGVCRLPPGSYSRFTVGRQILIDPVTYWDFDFKPETSGKDQRMYLEELHRLFKQAVRRQLMTDVPLGSYLSGGIDSGSISAVASRSLQHFQTFTCGFDLTSASGMELGFDERRASERLSYHFQSEHYEVVLKAGDMERVMPSLVWSLEEPRVGQSYPNYYAAKLASKFVKVVLAGTGGDELFGGYPWRYYRGVVNRDFDDYVSKYYSFWQRLVPETSLPKVLSPVWQDVDHVDPRHIFRTVFRRPVSSLHSPEDYVNHSLYFEAKTFLAGLLMVEDKLSMAHGLETRVPFLDNDLVDFACKLPVSMKLAKLTDVVRFNENEPGRKSEKYFFKTNDGKLLLREMATEYVPQDVADSVKQGFSGPDGSWFKGQSLDYVRKMILDPKARIYQFLNPKALRPLVDEHLNGVQNRRLLIWSLLNLEEWCRIFLERDFPPSASDRQVSRYHVPTF